MDPNQPLQSVLPPYPDDTTPRLPDHPAFVPEPPHSKRLLWVAVAALVALLVVASFWLVTRIRPQQAGSAVNSLKQVSSVNEAGWQAYTRTLAPAQDTLMMHYPSDWHIDSTASTSYSWRLLQSGPPANEIDIRTVNLSSALTPKQEWNSCGSPGSCGAAPGEIVESSQSLAVHGLIAYQVTMKGANGVYQAAVVKMKNVHSSQVTFVEFVLRSTDPAVVNLFHAIVGTVMQTTVTPVADSTVSWIAYSSAKDHISLKYPSNWSLTADAANSTSDFDSVTVTSPAKNELSVRADNGGKGGDCQPGATDVPFHAGNICPSFEYLSSEKLNISNVYYVSTDPQSEQQSYVQAPVYLVTSRFADETNIMNYGISMTQSTPDNPVTVNAPSMGYFVPYSFLTVYGPHGEFYPYVYIYSTSTDPAFLSSSDASMIKQIMRTVTITI